MGKVTVNQQEDWPSHTEVRKKFVGLSSSRVVRVYGKSTSVSVIGDRSTFNLHQHTGVWGRVTKIMEIDITTPGGWSKLSKD